MLTLDFLRWGIFRNPLNRYGELLVSRSVQMQGICLLAR
jgi:hypothetical protein